MLKSMAFYINLPFFKKAQLLYQKYQLAREYVDAINDLPPTYKRGEEINGYCGDLGKGELGMKQIFPDPVSEYSIKKKLDRANQAEKAWIDFCAKNNC